MQPSDPSPQPSHLDTVANPDAEFTSCWELAAWIGSRSSDDHLRSFTTILLALLHDDNALSRWFLRYAKAREIDLPGIQQSRGFRPGDLKAIRAQQQAGERLSGKPQETRSAINIVNGAVNLASVTGATGVSVRHLLAAYFYRLPPGHDDQFKAWGFDGHRDGSALLRQVKAQVPAELTGWIKVHEAAFGYHPDLEATDPVLPSGISGFAADTPEGEDHLDIGDDVYALSALICSTKVEPPLSIGLFGDWGSGKSFFIRQLQKGVAWISGGARGSGRLQKDVPFYKHVVQIEFNAWNYSGGNLWAALVQHILENLRLFDREAPDLLDKRRAHLQNEMVLERQVRDAATAKQKVALQKRKEATSQLDTLTKRHEEEVRKLKAQMASDVSKTLTLDTGTVEQLNDLRKELGLKAVASGAGEFLAALEGTRAVLRRASSVFHYVPKAQRARFYGYSAAVLVAPPLLALGLGALLMRYDSSLASIAAFGTWLSATLTSGAAWVKDRTKLLDAQVAKIETLQDHARQRVRAAEQAHQAEVAELEQRIALSQEEILAAQAVEREATARLEAITAQLAGTSPASVLADFVRERAESNDYRKHLGLPAVIRRDFENISKMIARENSELAGLSDPAVEDRDSEQRVNRIVLYIDDLDRCSEQLVVEVLQAVHLLLAFPLFVVVVAVDARWVSRSLATRFPGLLGPPLDGQPWPIEPSTEHATPSDYLEKIFQIPFWLRQPTEDHVRKMVRGLAGAAGRAAGRHHPDKPTPLPDVAPQPPVFRSRSHNPEAQTLDIQPDEVAEMERLAPLLERSPRALKRLVNVYRLLKASLPPDELDMFLEDRGTGTTAYRNVLLLLAIENGLPAVSEVLLDTLLTAPASRTPTLGAVLKVDAPGNPLAVPQAARLRAWLEREWPGWRDLDASSIMEWVPRVARYSYRLHRGHAETI